MSGVRNCIFFIPGRLCHQVGVFSGYGARSSPTLPLVIVNGVRYKSVYKWTDPPSSPQKIFLDFYIW